MDTKMKIWGGQFSPLEFRVISHHRDAFDCGASLCGE